MTAALVALAFLHKQTLKLPALFSDNVVLQRDASIPIFGTANPSETVSVQIAGQAASTTTGPDGKWMVKLRPMQAGGPYTGIVQGPSTTLTLKNIMIGEVWLCSGQSNMEMPESLANDYADAKDETNPAIRLFKVAQTSTEEPSTAIQGNWQPESKDNIGDFSAVAIAYGRELHDKLGVPIGLIQSTWGGTKAESWISRDAVTSSEALRPIFDSYVSELRDFPAKEEAFKTALHAWIASRSDAGNEGFLNGWENRILDDSQWKKVELPNTLDTIEPAEGGQSFDGATWFRKEFTLPDAWAGKALKMELGPISDYDDTYVNGTKVGFTKAESSDAAKVNRIYRVSPGVVLQGTNSIAIRIYAAQGTSGFTGTPDQMRLTLADGRSEESVPLAGEWREKVERKVDTSITAPHMPFGPGNPNVPGGLFNGMIAPLIPFGIKGVIWYQGEANVGNAGLYKQLFPALIRNWRQKWNQGDFPFYFVQLANYKAVEEKPGDSDWAELREAQAVGLKLANTGMACTIDLGDATTIHPKNKREVGHRLAIMSLSKTYGRHENWSGPEYNYVTPSDGTMRVFFKHVEDGLKTSDGKPVRGFAIAGDDRHFYWADARIEGSAIVLSNTNVPNPIAVRYGWADNPDVNLYNSVGLPASPFRTDSWPHPRTQP